MDILVTVGMSGWPFDRLIRAIAPLCAEHKVFAQIGKSRLVPPCPHARFVSHGELMERIDAADVVITHAGNTVRLVQRARKLPIVVARTAAAGEMANDHQVDYLAEEARDGHVLAVWDLDLLPQAVAAHAAAEALAAGDDALPPPAAPEPVAAVLEAEWDRVARNPYRTHPLRCYAYAWDELSARDGRHLDLGCGTGAFVGALAATTRLDCHGLDPHHDDVATAQREHPELAIAALPVGAPLPYPDRHFASVSVLGVFDHCLGEDAVLREIRRVLEPGGLLVLTVPRRHLFSWLDPKPVSYRRDWLVGRLQEHGFAITRESGANLFWRWFQIPRLLAGPRLRQLLDRVIWIDGQFFDRANLFLSARVIS